ncbi:8603_t:CDS:2 [Funneliformis geosporum]|nr:8603_t:CDS:2 [Funneliformis geosporum]
MGNSISNPSVKELSNLSNDIGQLFSSGDNYDMIIQAGEGQNMKEFFVHSLILAARSTYFKVELSLERKYKSNGIIIFKKPNISPEILKLILKFLYNGNVVLDNLSGTEVLKLFVVAFEWNLQNLINFIQPYLINNQVEYLRNEPVEILQMIFQFNVIARATSDNKYQKYAVFSSSDSGPAFGGRCGCGGCDLIIHGNSINRYVGAYPEVDSILHTKNTKTIVDYEIFQVIQV